MLFNVDVAEGIGNEEQLFSLVDAANVCCGAHAGSLQETERVLVLSKSYGIKVGAHPSYPDSENFGRVQMSISPEELKKSIKSQLSQFFSLAYKHQIDVFHVKPHGALYHAIGHDRQIASLFFEVLVELDFKGSVVGSMESLYDEFCKIYGYDFLPEAFADRVHLSAGKLKPRSEPNALLNTADAVWSQVKNIMDGYIFCEEVKHQISAKTICFHGDHAGAVELLTEVKTQLIRSGLSN